MTGGRRDLFIPDASREPPRCSGPHNLCGRLQESRTQFHVGRDELEYREACISIECCVSRRGDSGCPQEHVLACNAWGHVFHKKPWDRAIRRQDREHAWITRLCRVQWMVKRSARTELYVNYGWLWTAMEHSRIREDVVWEACDTIVTGEHPGASGARNLQIIRVLAIPVAEDVVWRDCHRLRGKPIFASGDHETS